MQIFSHTPIRHRRLRVVGYGRILLTGRKILTWSRAWGRL